MEGLPLDLWPNLLGVFYPMPLRGKIASASARRQWVPVTVANDEPVVPADLPVVVAADPMVAADEPMVDADVQDTVADTGAKVTADESERFPSGPTDPSVLTKYAEHVAASVWTGKERPELKLASHGRKVQKLGRIVPAIEGLVAGTGLSPLIACSVDIDDRGLISSFVERWHRETSSFHLPMGEVTITLDDMASLLHLPIIGDFKTFQPLHVDEAVLMLVDLLLVSLEAARAETGHYTYQRRCQARHWTAAARAYLLHLLGCTFFANKNATHVHVVFIDALHDLSQTRRYAWGVAALVHMYDHLNDACISTSRQLAGYITLLQCWIYEHFLLVVECNADPDYDEWIATKKTVKSISTETYRQCLDRLRIPDVCWTPYGEHRPLCWGPVAVRYRLERVMRQFEYVQSILAQPVDSGVPFDEIDDRWMHYLDHLVPAREMCVVPGQCTLDSIDWFFVISHPFMTATQTSDPPHIPQVREPHIPQVPEPAATSTPASSDADKPKHAVAHRHMRSSNNASGLPRVSQKTALCM
ncbi:Protein MAIN-LIKE 1 [Glycine soja]